MHQNLLNHNHTHQTGAQFKVLSSAPSLGTEGEGSHVGGEVVVRVVAGRREGQGRGRGQGVGGGGGGVLVRDGRAARGVGAVRIHSLLLLSPITKPDPDNLLLQAEPVRDVLDLLAARLGIGVEGSLERDPHGVVDAGPLLPPPGQRLLGGAE